MKVQWTNQGTDIAAIWTAEVNDYTLSVVPTHANMHPFKFFITELDVMGAVTTVGEGYGSDLEATMIRAIEKAKSLPVMVTVAEAP